MAEQASRIAAGRRRAEAAKQALAAGAVVAFFAAVLLARAGHAAQLEPGHASASQPAAVTDESSGFDLGGGSIAPGAPGLAAPPAPTGLSRLHGTSPRL